MKRNLIALIVFIVLTGIAVWLINKQGDGTIKEELKDFAIEDTSAITRIFLADKEGNTIDLQRELDNSWTLNGKAPARQDAVNTLLATMKTMEVRSPVSKAEFDHVVRNMASEAIKVEIYMGGDSPHKVYYVGSETMDTYGTYMMLENSSTPFVMGIPGFYGYLTTRFFTDLNMWKSAKVFSVVPRNIESIEVNHRDPARSFRIEGIAKGEPVLTDLAANKPVKKFDTAAVYDWASLFHNVHGEYFVTDLVRPGRKDTIMNSKLFTISVKETSGKTKTLTGYQNMLDRPTLNIDGDTLYHDVDRLYGIVEGSEDIMVIQYFVFDPLTPRWERFLPRQVVKN